MTDVSPERTLNSKYELSVNRKSTATDKISLKKKGEKDKLPRYQFQKLSPISKMMKEAKMPGQNSYRNQQDLIVAQGTQMTLRGGKNNEVKQTNSLKLQENLKNIHSSRGTSEMRVEEPQDSRREPRKSSRESKKQALQAHKEIDILTASVTVEEERLELPLNFSPGYLLEFGQLDRQIREKQVGDISPLSSVNTKISPSPLQDRQQAQDALAYALESRSIQLNQKSRSSSENIVDRQVSSKESVKRSYNKADGSWRQIKVNKINQFTGPEVEPAVNMFESYRQRKNTSNSPKVSKQIQTKSDVISEIRQLMAEEIGTSAFSGNENQSQQWLSSYVKKSTILAINQQDKFVKGENKSVPKTKVENIDTKKYLQHLKAQKTSNEFLMQNELGVMAPNDQVKIYGDNPQVSRQSQQIKNGNGSQVTAHSGMVSLIGQDRDFQSEQIDRQSHQSRASKRSVVFQRQRKSENSDAQQNNYQIAQTSGSDFHSKTFPTPTPTNLDEYPQIPSVQHQRRNSNNVNGENSSFNIENMESNHSKHSTSHQDKNGVNMLDQIVSGNPSPNHLITDAVKNQEVFSNSTRKIDNPSIITGEKTPDENDLNLFEQETPSATIKLLKQKLKQQQKKRKNAQKGYQYVGDSKPQIETEFASRNNQDLDILGSPYLSTRLMPEGNNFDQRAKTQMDSRQTKKWVNQTQLIDLALKGLNSRNDNIQLGINTQFSKPKHGTSPYKQKNKLPQTLLDHIRNDSISPSRVQTSNVQYNSMTQPIADQRQGGVSKLTHVVEKNNSSMPSNLSSVRKREKANSVMSVSRQKCASFLEPEEYTKLNKVRDYERFLRDHQMIESIMESQRSQGGHKDLTQRLMSSANDQNGQIFQRDIVASTGRKKNKLMVDIENKLAQLPSRNQPIDVTNNQADDQDISISDIQEYFDQHMNKTARIFQKDSYQPEKKSKQQQSKLKAIRNLEAEISKKEYSIQKIYQELKEDQQERTISPRKSPVRKAHRRETQQKEMAESLHVSKKFVAPDGESAINNLNFIEAREQIQLYLDIGDKFNQEVANAGDKSHFLKVLFVKLRNSFEAQQATFDKQNREHLLLHTETNNLLKTTLTLHHTCLQLKQQEQTYIKLIEEAKRGEDMFRERYSAAQDFLDSKKFVDILEKELLDLEDEPEIQPKKDEAIVGQEQGIRQKIQNALALGLDVLLSGADHDQKQCTLKEDVFFMDSSSGLVQQKNFEGFSGFSDKLKGQLDNKLADLNFSQVTNGLGDIRDSLRVQEKINKQGPITLSSQYNPDEQLVTQFYKEMREKFGDLQVETAKRVLLRTMNQKTYEECAVQVGENEINDEMARQMRDLGKINQEKISVIAEQENKICEHETNIFKLEQKTLKQLGEIREGKTKITQLSNTQQDFKDTIQKYEKDAEEETKRVAKLYNEIKILMKAQRKQAAMTTPLGSNIEPLGDSVSQFDASPDKGQSPDKVEESKLKSVGSKKKGKKKKGGKKGSVPNGSDDESDDEDSKSSKKGIKSRNLKGSSTNQDGIPEENSDDGADGTIEGDRKNKWNKKRKNDDNDDTIEAFQSGNTSEMKLREQAKLKAQIKNFGSSPRDPFASAGLRSMGEGSDADGNYSEANLAGKYNFGQNGTPNPITYGANGEILTPDGIKIISNKSMATQTTSDIFFEYILDFLKIVEERIQSGEINAQSLLPNDHPDSDYQRLEREIRKSQEKLNELQQILGRIASLRNKGGDVFFKGIAKTLTTNPVIPPVRVNRNSLMENDQPQIFIGKGQPVSPCLSTNSLENSKQVKNSHTKRSKSPEVIKSEAVSQRGQNILGYPQHILDFSIKTPKENTNSKISTQRKKK